MSAAQLSVKSAARTLPLGADEPVPAFSAAHDRGDASAGTPEGKFVLASRDVIDEVQQRMERRGFRWETS